MKKAIVHYFTGTGNSLLAAKQLCQELAEYGYEFTYHAIEEGIVNNLKEYSLHIFSFPVYATSVPHIMRKYIRKLPDGSHADTVVICTNGRTMRLFRDGYHGAALLQARLYLRAKNYNVFFSEKFDYPHNVINFIPPKSSDKNQFFIMQSSKKYTEIAKEIAKRKEHHNKFFYPNILWSIPFGILYSIIGRRLFGKLFSADEKCNNCGLCERMCPAKAIYSKKSGKFWRWNCEGCMRCINICPKRSIQTSMVRLLLIIWALVSNPLYFIYRFLPNRLLKETFWNSIFQQILSILLFVIFVVIMDSVLQLLSNSNLFRKIIGFGHTRFYGRYHAKQFESTFIKKENLENNNNK